MYRAQVTNVWAFLVTIKKYPWTVDSKNNNVEIWIDFIYFAFDYKLIDDWREMLNNTNSFLIFFFDMQCYEVIDDLYLNRRIFAMRIVWRCLFLKEINLLF